MTRRLGWASAQRRKLLVSLAVISAAASIAGLGTFATFTSSTSASQSVSSGTVTIALGATGASTNRLTVGASNIAPGDTIQRSVDLIDSGSIDLASITLTTNATPTSRAMPRPLDDVCQSSPKGAAGGLGKTRPNESVSS